MDDKRNKVPRDSSRISLDEEREVRYWTKTLHISELDLRTAVQTAGNMSKDVRAFLRNAIAA